MSTNWDLLIENHFDKKSENKLTLDTLLSAVSEVLTESTDLRTPIMERLGSPVSVNYDGIPEPPLTELGWNKLETGEGTEVSGAQRVLLENYLKNIAPGGDLTAKIKALDSFYASGFNQIESEKTNEMISKTLSYLVFYKTLTRIITNFNAASAGFTFEAFLATLLGGSQIKANTGTIADFKTADDIPISLKLYAEKTVAVGGSFTDLVRDLVNPKFSHPNGGMRYVVCTKSLAGRPGEQEGGIKFYEFDFTLDNVANIIAGANRAHTAANIILPLMEDEEGNLVLIPDVGDLEEPISFTDEQIDQAMRKVLITPEAWEDSGLKDFQINNIINSPLIGYQTEDSLAVTGKGAINTTSRENKSKITPLITDPETGQVSSTEIKAVFNVINQAYTTVVGKQDEINARRGSGVRSLQKSGIFPPVPSGKKKDKEAVANVKALAARSRDWYNEQDEETKKRALKYTMGYLKTQQFELNRDESTSGKLVDLRYLGEINIGSSHIQNVLTNCENILDENVTAIFTSLKVLTENLNDYFANGLNEDSKAFSAINAADDIETRTKEVSGAE
jgi:hypothetical protein|tara:strand:- start:192 stop:1880 length:1689 start_codon:yes stop_codon:yes gene_type:complete